MADEKAKVDEAKTNLEIAAEMKRVAAAAEKVYESIDEMLAGGASDVEYALIEGFKLGGPKLRIGSVTAGDVIAWSEANESEAKRTAGLRLLTKSLVGPEPSNIRYADDDKNIAKFRAMRHNVTKHVIREIIKLNGMSVKDEDKSKKD